LKHPNRHRHIPQSPPSQIQKINSAEQTRRRVSDKDLATMPCGHHPCGAVEHGAEVVTGPKLSFPGRDTHPHRQLESQLGLDSRIDSRARRCERSDNTIACMTEQEPVMRLDRRAQHIVVHDEG
jgi:hypothetical protein